jgi:hypothetical protein
MNKVKKSIQDLDEKFIRDRDSGEKNGNIGNGKLKKLNKNSGKHYQ